MMLELFAVACLMAAGPEPKPDLTPDQVVSIQLEALRTNDKPVKDAGIATTFRFASPGNQAMTGPVERFAQIVKGPGYKPLINHRIAGSDPAVVLGDEAIQRVRVIDAEGVVRDFEFRLSKDPKSKCWCTDGVLPIAAPPPVPRGPIT